jgi:hypothetical protein
VKKVVRIAGLVRTLNHVRAELRRGVSPHGKARLRHTAERAIGDVDRILADAGATPRQLAPPSRRAYDFLKKIDWESVAAHADPSQEAPAQPRGKLRWTGLGTFIDRLTARLSRSPSPAEFDEIARAIEGMSRRMEQTIQREGVGPDELTAATRELRGWLAWMAARENLEEYVAAVERAREALRAAGVGNGRDVLVEFRPDRHIYKMREEGDDVRVRFPTPMSRFGGAAFEDLAKMMRNKDREARKRVIDRMHGGDYADFLGELAALGGVVEQARGMVHDLAESFDRVNREYFAGAMERPHLSWSRSLTSRKFGHYDHARDWVMISSTLDQPQVPAFVVDYLMYHELLHKKHGIRWSAGGRGYAHTAAFYADERRFKQFDDADAWLKKLATAKP